MKSDHSVHLTQRDKSENGTPFSLYHHTNTPIVAKPTYKPVIKYLIINHFDKIDSLRGLGLFFIASGSGGLNPRAVAGGPSVTKLTHNKCKGVSGSGRPSTVAIKIVAISPILQLIKKVTNVCILLYIFLPSSTAATIDAKLSSTKIMSAAALATSVPVMPMAIPMSACLNADASLTPSPVMARN